MELLSLTPIENFYDNTNFENPIYDRKSFKVFISEDDEDNWYEVTETLSGAVIIQVVKKCQLVYLDTVKETTSNEDFNKLIKTFFL